MSLKDLRVARQWDKQTFADRIGISRQRLSEYELGKRDVESMTVGTAIKVLRASGHARTANTVARLLIEDHASGSKEDDAQ